MRTGEATLKLPYPDYQFDRLRKRLLPGDINGHTYKWMHTTDEKVFEDRANSRPHWKLFRRFVADLRRRRAEYDVIWTFEDTQAIAHVAWIIYNTKGR